MTDPSTLIEHTFPVGFSIWARESDHSYWRDVKRRKRDNEITGATDRLNGYSTVAKAAEWEPSGLMHWSARLDREGVAELASASIAAASVDDPFIGLAWLESGESIGQALSDAGLTWQDLRDAAKERGTNVHEQFFAALNRGGKVPSLAQATEDERAYAQGVLAAHRDHKFEAENIEAVVCDPALGVAGRLDFRGLLDGIPSIVDLKTGTYDSVSNHVQLAGYEGGARACGLGETERQMILYVNDAGGYEFVESVATEQDFATVLANYRTNKALSKRARDQRKAAA